MYLSGVASIAAALLLALAPAQAQLHYDPHAAGPVPVPPSERGLQTVTAEPWLKVSNEPLFLEGASFDRAGNLVFLESQGGRVFKVSPDRKMTVLIDKNELIPAGLAIHKDGRIFLAGVGDFKSRGSLVTFSADGKRLETLIPDTAGYLPDDLVFDDKGGFYFTDFKGTVGNPIGGVYYYAADGKISPILTGLAGANGIGLSPDGKKLWVTEFGGDRLIRISLMGSTNIAPFGVAVAYHFTGPSCDSLRVDSDGNLYVALVGQGRLLVFSPAGLPIGQILLPGRDKGHNLRLTNFAFRPGTNELFITASDEEGEGANIFHARGFATGLPLASHR